MDGASFWAQKRDIVKSADSPFATAAAQSPQQVQPVSKKPALLLKDRTNGAKSARSVNKTANWADSDEDDEFLKSFGSKQDSQVATLQSTIARKDAQIDELEANISVKNVRIGELETTVQVKVAEILHLEAHMTEQTGQLEQLKREHKDQYLHVQELVAEVDEKDRRIEKLEAELNEKGALIHDLEDRISGSVTTPSIEALLAEQVTSTEDSIKNTEEVADEPVDQPVTVEVNEPAAQVDESPKTKQPLKADEPPQAKKKSKSDEPVKSVSPQSKGSSKKGSRHSPKLGTGPSFGDSDFPVFVTPETLKVVPPAPKPKKMSFPVDLSKYGKKSAKESPPSPPIPKQDDAGVASKQILAPKRLHSKSNIVPAFNPTLDIRQMDHGKRVLYANGPQITVKLGEAVVATIPKYVFMQCSGQGYKHFTKNPDSTSITFSAGSMDMESAKAHLVWMVEMTYQGRVYSVTLNTDAKFDTKNLNICRAARVLGLNNTYVGHFTKQLCDRIRNNDISFEFMDMVCDLAYPENDPVFDCLANNLVNLRLRHPARNTEDIEVLKMKHENLKKKMAAIEKRVQNKKDNSVTNSVKQHSGHKSGGSIRDR